MDIGTLITLLKLFEESGLTSKTPQPPSSEAGLRPQCKVGEEAIYDPHKDEWRCQLKFK